MPKKISKRAAGKKLNDEQRLSPLATLQLRLEYYHRLATDEMALGELGSRSKIDGYLELAQSAAKELAPYRHPRLGPAEPLPPPGPVRIIRTPDARRYATPDEWLAHYGSPEKMAEEETRRAQLMKDLLDHAPAGGKAN